MRSETIGAIGPPHAHGHEPGREELRFATARRKGWPELNRDDLIFGRFGVVEHASGDLYRLHRGELVDALYVSAAAYYVDERGQVVFLERPPAGSPQTRAELEQRQAEQQQRRNAPTPRRQATRR